MKIEFDSEVLINRINVLCEHSGITKAKLFEECGLNKNIVNNLKRGSIPSVDKIAIIADYFNVSVDYLLGRTEDSTAETENIITVSSRPVQKIQEEAKDEPKQDGVTSEFFKVFEALDWSDKIDAMQFVRDRMRKSV